MSIIRKPAAAERESPLRRVAEAGLAAGQQLQRSGTSAGASVGGGLRKSTVMWLAGSMAIGALTASSAGGRLLGLLTAVPVCYVVWRWWTRSGSNAAAEQGTQQGSLGRILDRANDFTTLIAPTPMDALDTVTDAQERREEREVRDAAALCREDSAETARSNDFDADEALSRYLARKNQAQTAFPAAQAHASALSAARTFGRRTT